jgi:hypothetical protein
MRERQLTIKTGFSQASITNGTIEIRSNPKQDLSNLSRNTTQALNALGTIFDKKSVQEKQELAKLFGKEAYEQVHILSDQEKAAAQKELDTAIKNKASKTEIAALQAQVAAWDEGGANKIALHALVGGVMSDFGGNRFASGAAGAGLNEALQKKLSEIKDPALHQWASAAIGAAAAKTIGGNAQTGAGTAASGTKNNCLVILPAATEALAALGYTVVISAGLQYIADKSGQIVARIVVLPIVKTHFKKNKLSSFFKFLVYSLVITCRDLSANR